MNQLHSGLLSVIIQAQIARQNHEYYRLLVISICICSITLQFTNACSKCSMKASQLCNYISNFIINWHSCWVAFILEGKKKSHKVPQPAYLGDTF